MANLLSFAFFKCSPDCQLEFRRKNICEITPPDQKFIQACRCNYVGPVVHRLRSGRQVPGVSQSNLSMTDPGQVVFKLMFLPSGQNSPTLWPLRESKFRFPAPSSRKIVYRPWPVKKKASDHMFVNLGFASADNYM